MDINKTWYLDDPTRYSISSGLEFTPTTVHLTTASEQGYPYLINIETQPYTLLTKLNITFDSSYQNVRLQLSNDGETWYYFTNTTTPSGWIETTSPTGSGILLESNTLSQINANISQFVYDIDAGNFFYKIIFVPNGIDDIEIVSVNLKAKQYYTTIKKVRAFLKSYGLRAIDPTTGQYINSEDFLSDDKIEDSLFAADAMINSECQQDFYYHSDVYEYHDGSGKNSLQTRRFPIRKITHVVLYNQLIQMMRTFLDNELIIHPEFGELWLPPIYPAFLTDKPFSAMFGNIFIPGNRNLEILYDWGYDTAPEDIEFAARKYTAMELLRAFWAYISRGLTSRSTDGYSESMGTRPYGQLFEDWQQEIKKVLSRRKRVYLRSM